MSLMMNNVIDSRTCCTTSITSSDGGRTWYYLDGVRADLYGTGEGVPVLFDNVYADLARAITLAIGLVGICYLINLIWG